MSDATGDVCFCMLLATCTRAGGRSRYTQSMASLLVAGCTCYSTVAMCTQCKVCLNLHTSVVHLRVTILLQQLHRSYAKWSQALKCVYTVKWNRLLVVTSELSLLN